jgi:hypothetical protein
MEFTAKSDGPHQVILEFAWPIADAGVRELVNHAGATTGAPQAPAFDFSWQLFRNDRIVTQRESPQRSTGIVTFSSAMGLGGDPIDFFGLAFGDVVLKAGDVYTLRLLPGPEFGPILAVTPQVVVEFDPPMPTDAR